MTESPKPAYGPPPSWREDWDSPEDAVYDEWSSDEDGNVVCDVCHKPILTGKIVVAGGAERNVYMHEGCVQP